MSKKQRKPLHPEGCARNLPEALRLIKLYTKGTFDIFTLHDSIYTAQRADIMRGYCGRDVQFSHCTSGSMLDTLSEHANEMGANPPIESASQLQKWLKVQAGEAMPDSIDDSEERIENIKAENADDQGSEAAETPNLSASSGESDMSTAVAKKAGKKAKKPAGKKTGTKSAHDAKIKKERAKAAKAHAPKAPKAAKEPKPPKVKKEKVEKPAKEKKVYLLDVAADVVAKASEPMNVKQIIQKIVDGELYKFGAGKTPDRTLNSSIIREIKAEGSKARFKKVDRGMYTAR